MFSKKAWKYSHRAFDITTGSLTKLWRKSGSENIFPLETEIRNARQASGFENADINFKQKTITLKKNISFDFGGILKGYAAQKIISYLEEKNIHHALADAGGDIAVSGSPPGKTGWVVGINYPESENELFDKKLSLTNCAVATSGDIYRFNLHDGKKYSHIINPRTGYGVTSQRNVTVIANDGATADWLATACSILPVKKALRLVKRKKAVLFITTLDHEKLQIIQSKNFKNYFQKPED